MKEKGTKSARGRHARRGRVPLRFGRRLSRRSFLGLLVAFVVFLPTLADASEGLKKKLEIDLAELRRLRELEIVIHEADRKLVERYWTDLDRLAPRPPPSKPGN